MPHQLLATSFAFLMLLIVSVETHAQEIAKIRDDYHSGPITYSPDDPWTRSKLFNAHTGHSGKFYNCDGEECKRYSPYIYWQTNCQSLTPPGRGLLNQLRRDQGRIQQRIADGAGACACPNCPPANRVATEMAETVIETAQPIDELFIGERLPVAASEKTNEIARLRSTIERSLTSSTPAQQATDFKPVEIKSQAVESADTKSVESKAPEARYGLISHPKFR